MASSGHAGDPPPEQGQSIQQGESGEASANSSKRSSGRKSRSLSRTRTPKEKPPVRFKDRDHPGESHEAPLFLAVNEDTYASRHSPATEALTSWRRSSSRVESDQRPPSTLAADLADSVDITDSREQPTIRSSRSLDLISASTEPDLSNLIMNSPDKDGIMNERAVQTAMSQHRAHMDAQRLSRHLNTQPLPGSRTPSLTTSRSILSELMASTGMPSDLNDIPMREREGEGDDSNENDAKKNDEVNGSASGRFMSALRWCREQLVWPALATLSRHHSTTASELEEWWQDPPKPFARIMIILSTVLAQPVVAGTRDGGSSIVPRRMPRSESTGALDALLGRNAGRGRRDSIDLLVHFAETSSRQDYLVNLCEALIRYGAPTHRLEEYMRMSARMLGIEAQFFYVPTCMIIAFDGSKVRTSEMKLVRAPHGIDLGRMKATHDVFQELMNKRIRVDAAVTRLDEVMKREDYYGPWFLVAIYGVTSVAAGPVAFKAGLVDLPIAFVLGGLVGVLRFFVAPRSDLYTNIFEVSAAIFTSFFSRAFGSIRGGQVFCFSALAQSSLVLIFPSFSLFCGFLELFSKNTISGSIRVVASVIHSLFLGFGITVGSALYAAMDKHAISSMSCKNPIPTTYTWIFVPIITVCLIIISQGRMNGQSVVMVMISFAGYMVNHFTPDSLGGNLQISQAIGAFASGFLANVYARLSNGLAATALLPAVLVQAPSGLAAAVSMITGAANADQLTQHAGGRPTGNATMRNMPEAVGNDFVFNVGYQMLQLSIGITVGLFISTAVVYPRGKKGSGLFSY